jgi:hypothetical protein
LVGSKTPLEFHAGGIRLKGKLFPFGPFRCLSLSILSSAVSRRRRSSIASRFARSATDWCSASVARSCFS